MSHPAYLREKARTLRRDRRLTIDEIAERLALPRTTIFSWVRDLPVTVSRQTPRQRAGNLAMQRKYLLLREAAYEEGRTGFASLETAAGFRDFVVLYIAEGYKRSRNTVAIGNSDLAVVALADHWLRRLSSAKRDYGLQYHADQDLEALTERWAEVLRVDRPVINLQRKSNSGGLAHRTWRSRFGVLTVRCHDTLLRARLEGWMDEVREPWTRLAG